MREQNAPLLVKVLTIIGMPSSDPRRVNFAEHSKIYTLGKKLSLQLNLMPYY